MAKKKKARSLDDVELAPWRFIVFSDLHLSASTLERSLEVLRKVREHALREKAQVVFTGDFWDARGVLAVRQVVPLLEELERWRQDGLEAVIIPGNHDQVSMDGRLHGVRIFDPFPNIYVATERLLWPAQRLAFIPWREDPAEQQAMFTTLPGDGWTIFAHAEVEGATTNHAHTAPGRVLLSQIRDKARACYCGHYHKIQKLGDRTWYVGNPYQKDFGEIDDPPKGISLITPDRLEPEWIPLEGFPIHHRVTMGVPFDISAIKKHDVVEVYYAAPEAGSEDLAALLESIPADDVRPLPLKVEDDGAAPPDFALSLDEAISTYVTMMADAAEAEGYELPMDQQSLLGLGQAVLSELPEAQKLVPMSPRVDVIGVEVTDFCALRGTVKFDLEDRGMVLLAGPIGSGKTALMDAITWCLYDKTSPRKAGSHTSTFRGDEVIHDDADECEVTVHLRLLDGREVSTRRRKERGKGAKASVVGVDAPDGVKDTQETITRVVGLSQDLWRTCVSLGQGAVGNFVTDADTARKGLLSTAFGLDTCPAAQKLVRSRLKPLAVQVDKAKIDLASEQRAVAMLEDQDFHAQAQAWDLRRDNGLSEIRARGEGLSVAIAKLQEQLAHKEDWVTRRAEHEAHLEAHLTQLGQIGTPAEAEGIQKAIGAAQAERGIIERDMAKAQRELAQVESTREANPRMACPTCGQAMPATEAERFVAEKSHDIERAKRSIESFNERISNLEVQLKNATSASTGHRETLEKSLAETRGALAKIGEGLNMFTKMEAQLEEHQRALAQARAEWTKLENETNPWAARAAEHQEKIATAKARVEELAADIEQLMSQAEALAFWEAAFGPKGIPVLVLRTVLHELETHANRFLAQVLKGRVTVQLSMLGDALGIEFFETLGGQRHQRRYEQLSGGQRRCVELAFSPFGLSEMVFARAGVRVPLLMVDELTTHLGPEEKPLVCEALRSLDRSTVLVVDHDAAVQAEFDTVYRMQRLAESTRLERVTS